MPNVSTVALQMERNTSIALAPLLNLSGRIQHLVRWAAPEQVAELAEALGESAAASQRVARAKRLLVVSNDAPLCAVCKVEVACKRQMCVGCYKTAWRYGTPNLDEWCAWTAKGRPRGEEPRPSEGKTALFGRYRAPRPKKTAA